MPNFKNLNGYTVYDADAHNQINGLKAYYDNNDSHTINITTQNGNIYGEIKYLIYNNVCYGQVYLTIKNATGLPDQASGNYADGYLPPPPAQPNITQGIRLISPNNYYEGGSNKVFKMAILTNGQLSFELDFRRMTNFQNPAFYGNFSYPITGLPTTANARTKLQVPVEFIIHTDEDDAPEIPTDESEANM